jgi:hypothetical protein
VDSLDEWFRSGEVRRRPRRPWRLPCIVHLDDAGTPFGILRDLCRHAETSWWISESHKIGRVTLEMIRRAACRERLHWSEEELDNTGLLIAQGKVGRDRPELPPILANNPRWRVFVRRRR